MTLYKKQTSSQIVLIIEKNSQNNNLFKVKTTPITPMSLLKQFKIRNILFIDDEVGGRMSAPTYPGTAKGCWGIVHSDNCTRGFLKKNEKIDCPTGSGLKQDAPTTPMSGPKSLSFKILQESGQLHKKQAHELNL